MWNEIDKCNEIQNTLKINVIKCTDLCRSRSAAGPMSPSLWASWSPGHWSSLRASHTSPLFLSTTALDAPHWSPAFETSSPKQPSSVCSPSCCSSRGRSCPSATREHPPLQQLQGSGPSWGPWGQLSPCPRVCVWTGSTSRRSMDLGLDLDCHLGLGVLGSLICSWCPGLGLPWPLLDRGALLPGHDETENSKQTCVEVWTVEDQDQQLWRPAMHSPFLCSASWPSDDAEPWLPVIEQCYGSWKPVLCPRSTLNQQCYRSNEAAVSRGELPLVCCVQTHANLFSALHIGWTWLAVLRQCFSSGRAADGHTPYKAWPSQNWPKITTNNQVHQIFITSCTWFRCGVLCDRG